MFGLLLTLVATLAIAFASYKIGAGICDTDADKRDADRNTAYVTIAVGVMFLLCGILSMMSGNWNPFAAMSGGGGGSSSIVI